METLIHADIFFFITAIAVVFVSIVMIIALYCLIRVLRRFESMLDEIGDTIEDTGDHVRDMAEQVKESFVFNLLFPKKPKRKAKK